MPRNNIILPTVDFAFKKFLTMSGNEDLLISLINSVLPENDRVMSIEIQNPYTLKNRKEGKESIFDIKARSQDNKYFDIEMQMHSDLFYDQRVIFYWSKMYSEQLEKGKGYRKLNKAISINILNFERKLVSGEYADDRYAKSFSIREDQTHEPFARDLAIYTIELPKYRAQHPELKLEDINNPLECWTAFFAHYEKFTQVQKNIKGKIGDVNIKKALDTLETMQFTKEELEIYEAKLKLFRDEDSILETKRLEGKIEGKIKNQLKSAFAMFKENDTLEKVARVTMLPKNVVEKIYKYYENNSSEDKMDKNFVKNLLSNDINPNKKIKRE